MRPFSSIPSTAYTSLSTTKNGPWECWVKSLPKSAPNPSHPLATIHLLFASMDLTIMGLSCQWNHTLCGHLFLISFAKYKVFKFMNVSACTSSSFIFITIQWPTVGIYYILFIHSCIDGHLDSFHILILWINTALNIQVHPNFSLGCFLFLVIPSGAQRLFLAWCSEITPESA